MARLAKSLQEKGPEISFEAPAMTYQDIHVTALPAALSEIEEYKVKVQGLLSSLANGEVRGRLEPLDQKQYPKVYSLRLTKGDRLVFRVTAGDTNDGVRAVEILSAKGHYDHLDRRAKSTVAQAKVLWEPEEESDAND